MASADISDKTRRLLWYRVGKKYGMPECQNRLFRPSELTGADSYVGQECHIVARKDDPRTARSVPTLTDEEESGGPI